MRTASSSASACFSRTQWPSRCVEKHASQSWLACAPASESPSTVSGSASSSADLVLVVVEDRHAEARLEVGRERQVEHEIDRVTPRSRATSATVRSSSDGSGGYARDPRCAPS